MIIRIVHAAAVADTSAASAVDRDRLTRAAARIAGLETLIVGWRDDASMGTAPHVVVTTWLDVASMLDAMGTADDRLLRDRLGIDMEASHAESYELMSRTFGSLPTPTSILRIVTVRARRSGEADLFDRLRAIQERLTGRGLVASQVARRVSPDGVEAIVCGLWRDDAAVAEATSGDPSRPAFADEIAPWIESVAVTPYRAIEVAPHLPMASGPPIAILDDQGRVVDLTPSAAATLGRTQADAVGMLVSDLIGDAAGWNALFEGTSAADVAGRSAAPLLSGSVRIHWRLRRHMPVEHRHVLIVRREHEPEISAEDIDAAVAEAFPTA
jgi:PAS domain-containing protein